MWGNLEEESNLFLFSLLLGSTILVRAKPGPVAEVFLSQCFQVPGMLSCSIPSSGWQAIVLSTYLKLRHVTRSAPAILLEC